MATYRAAKEVSGGDRWGLLPDFRCDESVELSKKVPLPLKNTLSLFDGRVPAVEFESVRPWGSPGQHEALIDEWGQDF
jgi:hypothetical protein